MNYKHIVFDVDGTLLDTEYAVLNAFRDTLEQLTGRRFSTEELTFSLGITGDDALKRFQLENSEHVSKLWSANTRKYFDTTGLFPGIAPLLQALKERGFGLGIVTSKTCREFEEEVVPFGITGQFNWVVCADDTEEHKPRPAPLLKYMELSGARRDELLYIGDSEYDGQCARSAGVDFALAVWGSHTRDRPAQFYLERPADLLKYLD